MSTATTVFLRRRNRRQDKRQRVLKKMSAMREAKARKRLLSDPPEEEPKMERWFPLEVGFRDKVTGELSWTDFRGLRDLMRRARFIQNLYQPGIPSHL